MSEYEVSLSALDQAICELEQFSQSIVSSGDRLEILMNSLEVSNLTILTIKTQLSQTSEHIRQKSRKIQYFAETIECVKARYTQTENHIVNYQGVSSSTGSVVSAALPVKTASLENASALLSNLSTSANYKISAEKEYWSREESYGPVNVSAKIGTAEASAKIKTALFDKNGDFSPTVSASAGASVSALSAEASGEIGNEIMGISGSAGASVLSASAEGTLKAQLLDKTGNFSPTLKAEGNLQATAVEAEGSISGNVLGVSAGIHGSVNLGIGAHADIGFDKGVLNCDVGASLGIGAGVGFSIDIGGAVNTVISSAEAVYDFTKKLI